MTNTAKKRTAQQIAELKLDFKNRVQLRNEYDAIHEQIADLERQKELLWTRLRFALWTGSYFGNLALSPAYPRLGQDNVYVSATDLATDEHRGAMCYYSRRKGTPEKTVWCVELSRGAGMFMSSGRCYGDDQLWTQAQVREMARTFLLEDRVVLPDRVEPKNLYSHAIPATYSAPSADDMKT